MARIFRCSMVFLTVLGLWAISALARIDTEGSNPEEDVLEVLAVWWGFDPEDSTAALQAAIDSGAERVIVSNVGQDWVVRPIQLRSNQELVLEEGVVLTAKKGAYLGRTDSVLNGGDVENVIIRGYGATLRMHKEDYRSGPPYEKAEWRTGIDLRGVKNVQILGLTIKDTGGDGIYLGRGSRRITNEDVTIRDVIADNNYRQGISVITAANLLIENSVFKNTEGTPPQAGIDFEPNRPDEVFDNVVIRNSIFENNRGAGIIISLSSHTNESVPPTFLIEDVLIQNNTQGININLGRRTVPVEAVQETPKGRVAIRGCIVEDTRQMGLNINALPSETLDVSVEDCFMENVATTTGSYKFFPVMLEFRDPGESLVFMEESPKELSFGNVSFNNVVVIDKRERPVVTIDGPKQFLRTYLSSFSGSIQTYNPYGVWAALLNDDDGCYAFPCVIGVKLEAVAEQRTLREQLLQRFEWVDH